MSITEACNLALTIYAGILVWVAVDLAALAKSLMERPPSPPGAAG